MLQAANEASGAPIIDLNVGSETCLLEEKDGQQEAVVSVQWTKAREDAETRAVRFILSHSTCGARKVTFSLPYFHEQLYFIFPLGIQMRPLHHSGIKLESLFTKCWRI